MGKLRFVLSKCSDEHYENLLKNCTDWYNKKCYYTSYGKIICNNHRYDLTQFCDPLDFEKIGMIALKKEGDFDYSPIGNDRKMSMTELLSISFNKTEEEVKEVEALVNKKYFNP